MSKQNKASQGGRSERRHRKTSKLICKECRIQIEEELNWLLCEECEAIVCINCLKVPPSIYEIVYEQNKLKQKVPCIEIKCGKCKTEPSLAKVSALLGDLQKSQEVLASSVAKLDVKMQGMESRIGKSIRETIKKEMEGQVAKSIKAEMAKFKAEVEAKEAEIESNLRGHIDEKLIGLQSTTDKDLEGRVADAVRKARMEEKDKEQRKNSLILYNVPEPSLGESIQMKAEDEKFVNDLRDFLFNGEVNEGQVANVIRLGRRQDQKIRPIKVILNRVDYKFEMLKKSNRLQNCTEARFRDINLAPDKTSKERAEYKKLKEIIATANDPSLVIRRGKVIKLPEKKLQNKKKAAPIGGSEAVEENTDQYKISNSIGVEESNSRVVDSHGESDTDSDPDFRSTDEGSEVFSVGDIMEGDNQGLDIGEVCNIAEQNVNSS